MGGREMGRGGWAWEWRGRPGGEEARTPCPRGWRRRRHWGGRKTGLFVTLLLLPKFCKCLRPCVPRGPGGPSSGSGWQVAGTGTSTRLEGWPPPLGGVGGGGVGGRPNRCPITTRTLRPARKVSPEIQLLPFVVFHRQPRPHWPQAQPHRETAGHQDRTNSAGSCHLAHPPWSQRAVAAPLSHPSGGRGVTEVEVGDSASAAKRLPVRSPPVVTVAPTDQLPAGSGQGRSGNAADTQGRLPLK